MSSTTSAPSRQPPSSGSEHGASSCLNCGEPLFGRYCAACGQKATHPDPTLRELTHEAADELLHWDGKLLATLAVLFRRPGFLTAEYLAGRRARWVAPLRLYLSASVLYFAAIALVPRTNTVRFDFRPADRRAAVADSLAGGSSGRRGLIARVARNPERFREAFLHSRPKAMFVLLPFFALALRVLYRRRGRYPAHFIFALHLHAFAFLVLAAITFPAALSARFDVLEPIAFVGIIAYLMLALRRVYGDGWTRTTAKTAALALAYMTAFGATMIGLLALTALTFS